MNQSLGSETGDRCSKLRDASPTLSMTERSDVEYGDLTVSMSEAARRAVMKLG